MLIRTLTRRSVPCRASILQSHLIRSELTPKTRSPWRITRSSRLAFASSTTGNASMDAREASPTIEEAPQKILESVEPEDGQKTNSGQDEAASIHKSIRNAIAFYKAVAETVKHEPTCSGYGWTVVSEHPRVKKVYWR